MQNRPVHDLLESADTDGTNSSGKRLAMIGVILLGAIAVVPARVAWLQTRVAPEYQRALQQTSVEYESIPARDGRILTQSGVLAADVDQYSITVHYRWLQEPVDEDWMTRQIRRRLSAGDRKNKELVAHTREEIESERPGLWLELSALSGETLADLDVRRAEIQSRVQRISESVNRRHQLDESDPTDPSTARRLESGSLMQSLTDLIGSLRRELTTPPQRQAQQRITVREEEDFHTILEDVPLSVASSIRENPSLFPGVEVVVLSRRVHPRRELAAHVVGTRTEVRDDERPVGSDHSTPVRRGRFGVELSWDHRLRGIPGRRRVVRNHRHEVLKVVDERKPVSGQDVLLTINPDLQQVAERLLAESLGDRPRDHLAPIASEDGAAIEVEPVGGAIVVMDVQSGRLLAAASAPTFDLNLYHGGSVDAWESVRQDHRKPMYCRLTGMAIPPGSVFKTLSSVAMLESRVRDADSRFDCHGFLHSPEEHRCLIFRSHGVGHGPIALTDALAQSCNVYFFSAAASMGAEPLELWSHRFGFGQRTEVDLPFESRGQLARLSGHIEPLGFAIGQDSLVTTPLQIARMMAAVANDGWLVTPHVVSQDGIARSAKDTDDTPRQLTRIRIPGLSPNTLAEVRAGLASAVADPGGTAYRTVRLETVSIAGKTGTAQSGSAKPDHAWFAGYTPSDNPRYAFVVVLEHGGSGSRAAGPVARALVLAMLELNLLPSDQVVMTP